MNPLCFWKKAEIMQMAGVLELFCGDCYWEFMLLWVWSWLCVFLCNLVCSCLMCSCLQIRNACQIIIFDFKSKEVSLYRTKKASALMQPEVDLEFTGIWMQILSLPVFFRASHSLLLSQANSMCLYERMRVASYIFCFYVMVTYLFVLLIKC